MRARRIHFPDRLIRQPTPEIRSVPTVERERDYRRAASNPEAIGAVGAADCRYVSGIDCDRHDSEQPPAP